MSAIKPRLHHFDVLKGIAIFMVVMGHIITMCIRDLDRATIFKFIGEIHMPLFFFISGWFTFGLRQDGSLKMPRLGARAKQLLVPMLVVSSLWIWYYPHSGLQSPLNSTFGGLWTDLWKNGYWFTPVLFVMIAYFALLRPVFNRAHTLGSTLAAIFASWGVLVAIFFYINNDQELANTLSLSLIVTYWPAFMAGYAASRFRDGFDRLTTNGWCTAPALIVGSFALYFTCWWWDFCEPPLANHLLMVSRPVFHICLAVVAIAVFKPTVQKAYTGIQPGDKPAVWVRVWTYLGVNSLGIYLLHYFFLFPLGCWKEAMEAVNVGFVPLLTVSAVSAAVIIAVVLGFMRIISVSAPVNFLLTGTLPSRK